MTPAFSDQLLAPIPRQAEGLRYVIVSERSAGSEWLSGGLLCTGLAGEPAAFFDDRLRARLRREFGVHSDAHYLPKLIELKTTPNSAFGMNLSWSHLDGFAECLLATAAKPPQTPIGRIFPRLLDSVIGGAVRYVWLRRRNKVAQALSLHEEQHTHARTSQEKNALRGDALTFDFAAIDALVRHLTRHESNWGYFFRKYEIEPLIVFYEELVHDYEQCVRSVLRFLDLPDAPIVVPSSLVLQPDDRALRWEKRYQDLTASDGRVPVRTRRSLT